MTVKRNKKFRLFKIPRYLPGSVKKSILKGDLKQYNEHRYKVFNAAPLVDDSPPNLNPLMYLSVQRISRDAERLTEINKLNCIMLKKINLINRTGGYVDTFNPIANERRSNWRRHEQMMKAIDYNNETVYRLITKAASGYILYSLFLRIGLSQILHWLQKSEYDKKDMDERWKHLVEKIKMGCKFPICIFGQLTLDQRLYREPSISDGLGQQELRPKCYMDIRIKNGVYLGRMIIELYRDYVPVTVQNFLAICRSENKLSYVNCPIHRIYPGKYMEAGDITKGNGKGGMSVYGKSFPEENYKLKHTKAGVLAMRRLPQKTNNSQFRIMFTALPELDTFEVVFGRVIRGNDVLMKINDLGKKSGVPYAPVLIMQCGKFTPGKTPLIKKYVYGFRPAC